MCSLKILKIINVATQIILITVFSAVLTDFTYILIHFAKSKDKLIEKLITVKENFETCYGHL
jgi:hypothetical protein